MEVLLLTLCLIGDPSCPTPLFYVLNGSSISVDVTLRGPSGKELPTMSLPPGTKGKFTAHDGEAGVVVRVVYGPSELTLKGGQKEEVFTFVILVVPGESYVLTNSEIMRRVNALLFKSKEI